MDPLADLAAELLSARADPVRARRMAAYLKTDMPFYGVPTPDRKPVLVALRQAATVDSRASYERAVVTLWERPHREERYLAIGLARAYPAFVVFESVPLYRRMIVEGAWWDLVDDVAANLVGRVLLEDRAQLAPVLEDWIGDADLWLRRAAIISQLRHKEQTDPEMLFRFCLSRAAEKEFFIRKAIGWALREYAKTAPDAVGRFVLDHRDAWSGLTYREAAKHLRLR